MAQLDSLIISPLLWSLLLVLILYYSISIEKLIPSFFVVKKFSGKKLNLSNPSFVEDSLKFKNSCETLSNASFF